MKHIINRISNWETWPFKIIYAPLVPVWLWYTVRSGSVWFFTSSNPKLTFGGMEGEPKKEMYALLPPGYYPPKFNVLPQDDFDSIKERLILNQIRFPLIVKPEIGEQGLLFRKLDNEDQLREYHNSVPVEFIVQQMVQFPMEVSVFYIRHPNDKTGKVTGFLQKIPLHVVGEGYSNLGQLIAKHPKASGRIAEMRAKHAENWDMIINNGEKYFLSYAANHNRGAQFIDLKDQIDDKLVRIFDDISIRIDDFFYGRYDIMCNSVADLKEGRNFSILEYNGCGAEPNHFYDTGYSLRSAYKEILFHWKALYEISNHNKSKGIQPWPFRKGKNYLQETQRHFKLIRKADERIV